MNTSNTTLRPNWTPLALECMRKHGSRSFSVGPRSMFHGVCSSLCNNDRVLRLAHYNRHNRVATYTWTDFGLTQCAALVASQEAA